jgi:hypothetical protein
MGAAELRNKIIQLLNTENINYLKGVFEFAEKSKQAISDDTIVAHTIKGKPVLKSEYVDNNNEAVNSFQQGNYKTQSQLREKYQTN